MSKVFYALVDRTTGKIYQTYSAETDFAALNYSDATKLAIPLPDGVSAGTHKYDFETESFVDKPPFQEHLSVLKAGALARINNRIDAVRRSFATDIAFQQEAYYTKRTEAETFLAQTPAPTDLTPYPLLNQIHSIRGLTPTELATLWVTTNDNWKPILDTTEVIRERALVAVLYNATTAEEVTAALSQLETDLTNENLL